jgi:uncharacterized protein involved in exopolysaccharide biosynthesis
VAVLRRWWLTLVVMTLLGVGAAAVLSQTQTRKYSAQTQLLVEPLSSASTSNGGGVMTPEEAATQVEGVITSRPVAATVGDHLGLDETPETLLKSVTVAGVSDTSVLTISGLRPRAGGAAAIANSFADAYLKQAAEQRGTVTQSYRAFTIVPATIPTSPAEPRPLRSELLGGIVGLLLGVGLAFIRDHFDDGHRGHSG